MPPKKRAPKPKRDGYDAAAERLKRASQGLKVTVPGTDVEPYVVPMANIPGPVRRIIRRETGSSFETLTMGDIGLDTYVFLWWVSRILNGEPIALAAVEAEWDERCAGVRIGDLETETITLHDGSDEEADPAGETQGQPT